MSPPAVSRGSTVVEVWVERLNPAQGEDFGWERVQAATAVPRTEPARTGGRRWIGATLASSSLFLPTR